MKITNKLLLVAAGFLIPILLLIYLLVSEKNIAIDFAEKELHGAEFLEPLQSISAFLPIHEFITINLISRKTPVKEKLLEVQNKIDENFHSLEQFSTVFSKSRVALSRVNLLKQKWIKLKIAAEKGSLEFLEEKYRSLRQDIKNIIKHVGDESNLKLDPHLDSYYLMIAVLEKIPAHTDNIFSVIRTINDDGLKENSGDLSELTININSLKAGLHSLRDNFDIVYENNPRGDIKKTLEIHFVEQEVLTENFIDILSRYDPRSDWFEKISIVETGISIVESNLLFWQLANDNLQYLIRGRISHFNEKKIITLFIVSFVIALTLALFLFIARNISRSVKTLDTAANRVISGELNVEVNIRSADELGNLSINFNKMIKYIGRNIKEKTDKLLKTENALYDERIKHNQAEEALSKSEALFSKVWGISADGMRLTNENGIIITVNDAYCNIVGIPKSKLEGSNFSVVYKEENRHTFEAMYTADLKHNKIKPHFERESELWNGDKIWFSFSNSYLRLTSGVLVLSIIKDITERKKAEFELKESTIQLRNLASHLQSIREEERRMIAREIHDELGQVLTVLKIQISLLSNKLRVDQTEIKEKIFSVSQVIDQTVETVQRITSKLRPGILDDLGLFPAIEWQAQDFESKTGIICDCELPAEDIELEQEKVTAVFRIFQEALTNVARHANANTVRVRVKTEGELLRVRITDNGKGITAKEIADYNSLGLLGMKERAMLFNGEVKISGEPNKGTSVSVTIPLTTISTVKLND